MNKTRYFFQSIFMVRRSLYPIGPNGCDAALKYFPSHNRSGSCDTNVTVGGGIADVDYLMYLVEGTEDQCWDHTLAYAYGCETRAFDGRPLAGMINLCVQATHTENWNLHALERTVQHELFHAMGFDYYTLYNHMIRVNGQTRSITSRFARSWKINTHHTYYHDVKMVVSPRVKTFTRDHFNCTDLEGGEIENDGGDGTGGVHWEIRMFGPETMTGYISRHSYITDLTMAYFEDTTWYKTRHDQADGLAFGKNHGCIFAMGSCREYIDSMPATRGGAKPFCNWEDYVEKKRRNALPRDCSEDRTYYSKCDWKEETNESVIEAMQHIQYFADKWTMVNDKNITGYNIWGNHPSRDGCPQWSEYYYAGGRKDKVGDSICRHKYSQPPATGNWNAEIFGADSKCFNVDGKFEVFKCLPFGFTFYDAEWEQGAGCYNYTCDYGRLMIQANHSEWDYGNTSSYTFRKEYKVCWGAGSVIQIRRHQYSGERFSPRYHKGVIICPPCKEICENNDKYPNFKCLPDIRLNTTDFAMLPCPQSGNDAQRPMSSVSVIMFHFLLMLLSVLKS